MAGPLIVPGERTEDTVGLLETDLFIEGVYRQFGVDYRGFERDGMHARLDVLRAQEQVASVSALQGQVLHDPAFARRAMQHLSASTGPFLRSPSAVMALRLAALPVLRSQSWPVVWLAECADAGFVREMVEMLEQEGLLGKTQLFVTNANEDVLREAMRSGAHENIVWAQYDLASDASFKEFHLIVCQRPLRDFALPLQRRALGIFSQSLSNFGILQLEPPVNVLGPELSRDFTCLLGEQGIYRKRP